MEDLAKRQQNREAELTLYDREQIPYVTYQDFVDKGLLRTQLSQYVCSVCFVLRN